MNLKDCPVPIYGDINWRGRCPEESHEQMSFFNRLRKEYPYSYGLIALHPRNEGLKERGQFSAVIRHAAEGMTAGAADIIIPGKVTFVCEMKRQNHVKSAWQDGQREYLAVAQSAGAFACIALGAVAAWQAFEEWRINWQELV